MKPPDDIFNEGIFSEVLSLKRTTCGLKQSGRAGNSKLDAATRKTSLIPCTNESCLHKSNDEKKCMLIADLDLDKP